MYLPVVSSQLIRIYCINSFPIDVKTLSGNLCFVNHLLIKHISIQWLGIKILFKYNIFLNFKTLHSIVLHGTTALKNLTLLTLHDHHCHFLNYHVAKPSSLFTTF